MYDEHWHTASDGNSGEHGSTRRDGTGGRYHGHVDAEVQPPAAAASSLDIGRPAHEQAAAFEAAVQQRLAGEQAKCENAELRLAHSQADFSNYRRRTEQEREQRAQLSNLLLVRELLPVLDSLDRAVTTVPEAVAGLPWMEGLLLVDRQLRATLEKQGLQPIVAIGTRFDPTIHEALLQELTSDYEDDAVIAELQRGYLLHDTLVRPTLVKVAKHVVPAAGTGQER